MKRSSLRRRKKIHRNVLLGQEGVNIVEAAVLKMGFVWSPMSAIEAGVDGTIEIRDPSSGDMLHSIIRVQSKATSGVLQGDTGSSFTYLCEERDLEYWLAGNVPVILVRSRTETREAYWVSLKEYFRDPERRKSRTVTFNKVTDRFDQTAAPRLRELALPTDLGAYSAPLPKREALFSNLLIVSAGPKRLFHAVTEHGTRDAVRAALLHHTRYPPREYVAHGKTLLSVHDLSEPPWCDVVDPGTVEAFPAAEWADADDDQKRRDYVELLNHCLEEKLGPAHVRFHEKRGLYFFAATSDLAPRSISYESVKQKARKEVFGPRVSKKDSARIAYYRHSAFVGHFVRHDGSWFLEIEPTYFFTFDGRRADRFGASRLTGIKRLERNPSVLGQLHMWTSVLTRPATLFRPTYPHLSLGALQQFDLDWGVDDAAWLKREDEPLPAEAEIEAVDALFQP